MVPSAPTAIASALCAPSGYRATMPCAPASGVMPPPVHGRLGHAPHGDVGALLAVVADVAHVQVVRAGRPVRARGPCPPSRGRLAPVRRNVWRTCPVSDSACTSALAPESSCTHSTDRSRRPRPMPEISVSAESLTVPADVVRVRAADERIEAGIAGVDRRWRRRVAGRAPGGRSWRGRAPSGCPSAAPAPGRCNAPLAGNHPSTSTTTCVDAGQVVQRDPAAVADVDDHHVGHGLAGPKVQVRGGGPGRRRSATR